MNPEPIVERDPLAFFADCRGKVLRRTHFAYLGASDSLVSPIMWGHIGKRDIAELLEALIASGRRAVQRDAIVQMQAVEGIEEEALRDVAAFMQQTAARGSAVTMREAVVRPGGTMGMIVAGFYEVVAPLYPVKMCATLDDALDGLAVDATTREWLVHHSEEERQRGLQTNDLAYRLREYLATHVRDVSLATAAAELKVSLRTLQRRLRDAGIRFDDELGRARLAAAKNLLLRTEHDLKRIGLEVGCVSPSRLSQLFRALEGTTPTAWRTLHRR